MFSMKEFILTQLSMEQISNEQVESYKTKKDVLYLFRSLA